MNRPHDGADGAFPLFSLFLFEPGFSLFLFEPGLFSPWPAFIGMPGGWHTIHGPGPEAEPSTWPGVA